MRPVIVPDGRGSSTRPSVGPPAPTAELQQYIASGQLRNVIASGGGGGPGASSSSDRTSWVTSACTVVDYGGSGSTLYDCAGAVS